MSAPLRRCGAYSRPQSRRVMCAHHVLRIMRGRGKGLDWCKRNLRFSYNLFPRFGLLSSTAAGDADAPLPSLVCSQAHLAADAPPCQVCQKSRVLVVLLACLHRASDRMLKRAPENHVFRTCPAASNSLTLWCASPFGVSSLAGWQKFKRWGLNFNIKGVRRRRPGRYLPLDSTPAPRVRGTAELSRFSHDVFSFV